MSYRSTKTEEPTEEEYNQLVSANEQWYNDLYATFFESNPDLEFVDIQLILNETLHGDDVSLPSPDYNIYMVSKIQRSNTSAGCLYLILFHIFFQGYEDGILRFTGTSKNIPAPFDLYVIYTDGITQDYLINVVRALSGTPFSGVLEGYTAREGQLP